MKSDTKIDSRIEIKVDYVDEINQEIDTLRKDFAGTLAQVENEIQVDGSGHNINQVRDQLVNLYTNSKNECFNRSVIDILQLISELEELEKYREMDSQYRPR